MLIDLFSFLDNLYSKQAAQKNRSMYRKIWNTRPLFASWKNPRRNWQHRKQKEPKKKSKEDGRD